MSTASVPPRDEQDPVGDTSMPKRYLSVREVADLLGIGVEAAKSHRGRRHALVGEPDIQVGPGGSGTMYGWDPARFTEADSVADDPALLGKHPERLAADMLIGPKMWATLEGVKPATVLAWRYQASLARAEGDTAPGDLPSEDMMAGISPRWRLDTYRAWRKAKSSSEEK